MKPSISSGENFGFLRCRVFRPLSNRRLQRSASLAKCVDDVMASTSMVEHR